MLFCMLVVPLILIVFLLIWHEEKEVRNEQQQLLTQKLHAAMNDEAKQIEDILISFQIFAKSSHPLTILRTRDEKEFDRSIDELDLIKRGMGGVYMYDFNGALIMTRGKDLFAHEKMSIGPILFSIDPVDPPPKKWTPRQELIEGS
jgi:hypothetical protein